MNYYAKLAEEKRNSVVDKGTIRGKRYEIVKLSSISYIGYIYDSEGDRIYKTGIYSNLEDCKKAIETNDRVFNSKEKSNSTVARGTVHGHKYEVDRMSDSSYMGYVYDEEGYPIFKTGLHSTAAGAEKEIKSKVFNSKENSMNYYEKIIQEKRNASDTFYTKVDGGTYLKGEERVKRFVEEMKRSLRASESNRRHIEKNIDAEEKRLAEFERQGKTVGYDYSRAKSMLRTLQETLKDYDESEKLAREEIERAQRWLSEHRNSKEEKDNENFHYLGKTFSVTSGNFHEVRRQVQQAYKDKVAELEKKISSASGSEKSRLESELREVKSGYRETMQDFDRFNNSKEKSYYAKIIEEKKNRIEPEEEMKKLQALKPIVEAFKRKGMTKHEVATRLMQEKNISETLAQQCVDSWY